jgi:hypothetical protein
LAIGADCVSYDPTAGVYGMGVLPTDGEAVTSHSPDRVGKQGSLEVADADCAAPDGSGVAVVNPEVVPA